MAVEAELPWGEIAFPALVAIGFETPTWFPAGGPTPPASRASAGLVFYEGGQSCALLFGGFEGPPLASLRGDVVVRCEGGWQLGSGVGGLAVDPTPGARQSPAMAYAPFGGINQGAYLFGGYAGGALGDLWRVTLSGAPGGARSASWTRIGPPQAPAAGTWPPARYEAGLAWTGSELLLFGGLGAQNQLLSDSWAYNGSSWRKLCEGPGCFPERRSFATTARGEGATREVLAVGGFGRQADGTFGPSSEVLRFTSAGWQRVDSFEPAAEATLADGRLSPAGQSAPGPRESFWAAGSPSGGLLLGSGIFDFER
ncbi:MAG TPA: kelch repeat-containing protein, partial [Polyangiaceae bacterium]|nr:kelch repeat-containing protein [Polyangiaceae bacterium]